MSLVCGYSAEDRARKLIVALQAFVDDSQSNVEGRNFVLAGYVHRAEEWLRFSDDWKVVLNAPPKIDYFRMVEAEHLRGQFGGWTESDRDAKIDKLGRVIREHAPQSFECWVSERAFNEIVKPVAPYDLQNPYMVCFYGVIVTVARFHASEDIKVPVDFVFDEQGGLGAFVVFWYEWIKQWQDPSISALLGSTPVFRDDKGVLPLQAADMLAWHLRRRKELRYAVERRPVMEHIFGNHVEATITEDVLRSMAHGMAAIPGDGDVLSKKGSIRRLLRDQWENTRKLIERMNDEDKRIRQVQQLGGKTAEGSAQRDEGQTGSGKAGEKAEEI